MSDPTGLATFDRLAALIRQLAAGDGPPQPDWRSGLLDVLGDLEYIVARADRWPDAALQAVSAAMSLALVFVPMEAAESRASAGSPPPLDLAAMTWTCMVCDDERPDAAISVAHRPMRGLEDLFPDARVNVRYCNDRPGCVDVAHQEGVWVRPGSPDRTGEPNGGDGGTAGSTARDAGDG